MPSVGAFFERVGDLAVATLLPSVCVGCGAPLGIGRRRATLCEGCWGSLPRVGRPFCRVCFESLGLPFDEDGDPIGRPELCGRCERSTPHFGRIRSGGPFEGALRSAIHALKYRRHDFLARHLVEFLLGEPEAAALLGDPALLVPVPMHRAKKRDRGYNPAERIAAELSRQAGVPMRELLCKRRATMPQSGLDLAARRENVRDSFALARRFGRPPRRIVLVDDVATTGTTLDECARVLRAAGTREIDAVTLARTTRTGSITPMDRPAQAMARPRP